MMITLGNRAHVFAHPDAKEKITAFFTTILDCKVFPLSGIPTVLVVRFPNTTMSIEFTEDALDANQSRRGAWLEIKTDDVTALKEKIRVAGLMQIMHASSERFYFQAPGGQVWGIVE